MSNDKTLNRLMLEFEKRKDNQDGTLQIIGAELKSKRLKLAKTLKSVSNNICSISYASKLENNLINSNRYIINEYGKKVGLDENKIQALYDLKLIIISCIDSFFENDFNYIKDQSDKCLDFTNYRSVIIRLINSLIKRKMDDAYKYILEIMKITSTLTDFDLNVFSLFYAIYLFYAGLFNDALELIDVIDGQCVPGKFSLLKELYSFYIHIALSTYSITEKYQRTKELFINSNDFEKIDKLTYYLCISFIKKKDRYHFYKYYELVKNESYRCALTIVYDFLNDFKFDYKKYKKSNIIFADALLELSKDPEYAKSYLVNNNTYYIDYNYYILKYLIYKRIEGTDLLQLLKEVVDYGTTVEDPFFKGFIYDEAVKYSGNESKYKFIYDIYLKFWGIS